MSDHRTTEDEAYLGDAVYASFDGWQIRLRTGDGNNQVIYLEPNTYHALQEYVRSLSAPTDPHEDDPRHEPEDAR